MHGKNKKIPRSRLCNTLSLYLVNNRVHIDIYTMRTNSLLTSCADRVFLALVHCSLLPYVCKIIQRIRNIM